MLSQTQTAADDDDDNLEHVDDQVSRVHQERRSRGRLLSRKRYQETNDDSDNTDKSEEQNDKTAPASTKQVLTHYCSNPLLLHKYVYCSN